MNESIEREILGDYVDQGYWLKEYDSDHTISVGYKEKEIAAYSQTVATTTPEVLRDACKRHMARLREAVEVTQ